MRMSVGMEFLKTCNTNAQAIGEFEAVAYQAFSVKRSARPSLKLNDRNPSEDLHAVEAEFRQGRHLVIQDAQKSLLWSFRATTADKAGQKPMATPVLEGYEFQAEQSGVMKASELARLPIRTANSNTPSSTSSSSPSTPGPTKGPQGGNIRAAQGNSQPQQSSDQQQQHDSYAIYELFMSSVIALISYHLVKDHKAVALNFRTFLSKPLTQQNLDRDESNISGQSLWLTNVNAYWTSSGTLVISTFSTPKPEVYRLDELKGEDAHKQAIGSTIRVAPNGLLAKVVSFEDPTDAAVEDFSHRLQRKRLKLGSLEQGIEKWKTIVTRWLKWKGYTIPNLDTKASWVKIRIGHSHQLTASSPSLMNHDQEVLWPRALCFFYNVSLSSGSGLEILRHSVPAQRNDALEWFETSNSVGFQDPLDVAQQWFLGKPERDKAQEARRKAQLAEEEAAHPKEENAGLYPSSPLYARTGAYGDLQAVGGVYPTPPDGIAPGTGVPNSENPSVSGAAGNTILAPGGNNPGINLSAPQDTAPATSPEFPLPFDQFNTSLPGGNDDLFGDTDEDVFDGNRVTDADFNFFDEPDGDDIDMMDGTVAQDSKPSTETIKKEEEAPILPDSGAKEDMSDPMAALDDALASASGHVEETTREVKTEQQVDDQAPAEHNQVDVSKSKTADAEAPTAISITKEPSPPLSPRLIQQALLPSPRDKPDPQTPYKQTSSHHKESIFDPVSFNRKLSLLDAKYHDGRFSFPLEKSKKESSVLKLDPKGPASLRDLPLLTKLRQAIGIASAKAIPELEHLDDGDSDLSDSSSETSPEEEPEDIASIGPEPLSAGLIMPGKRKLPTDGNATPISTTSFADSFGGELQDAVGLQTDDSCLVWFEPTPWDWSLANMPPPVELPSATLRNDVPAFSPVFSSMPNTPTSQPDLTVDIPDEKPLSGKDSIAVAQIVTDQIVHATLDILHEDISTDKAFDSVSFKDHSCRSSSEPRLQAVIKHLFPKAADCNVLGLASVQDVFPDIPQQARGQQRPPPRRQGEGSGSLGYAIYPINPPHIRVRRSDTLWDLLPPALSFWEPLGLSPCSLPKNIVAFCIYPHSDSLRPCLENLLVNIQIAYESCRLGNHARVETVPDFEGGLVPCKVMTPTSTRAAFKALRDTCIQLGKLLAVKHSQMRDKGDGQKIDAFVIYMVDPFETPSAVWELCSAFWSLFQAYGQGPSTRPDLTPKPDIVLQIVPMKYISSFDVPVVLDSSTYINLAREVYDRCPPSAPSGDRTPLSIYAAPSFQLEEALPRAIQFKLIAEPPQDLLRENSYMHLGYAVSLDSTWITAAWTDNCGKSQAVVSYNIGLRAFGEIAREIWQTTIEILQARKVTWRICIAKAGVMEREELETWVFLASCPTQLNLFITLLTIDTAPPFKFTPTLPTNPSINPSAATNLSSNTPGSTPQAGVSPDQHGLTPAATPSENTTDPSTDPDARLVDITDESWGIILSHRLHNTNSTTEFRPCLISGLLVKRGPTSTTSTPRTPDPERGPIVLGVNILWVGAVGSTRAATSPFPPGTSSGDGVNPGTQGPAERQTTSLMWTTTAQSRATAENLLKEVLGQFRALGLLARLKGVRGTRNGTVPWHVAVAVRGVKGLGRCV
ncbi:hypothetical protein K469DRAFT_265205 [Zopfia rhizophila CBS 207.26]|uniref:Mediator of RNA polymerase II transcription subunit 13 n=1 Tax=Zopfia rhizophila CBS 207.26 TaxID=1314779 RepID=A0A6A6DTV0_9PEZI|nr:hypothetical protein K469DRAFT_265205 [Zopfia rhizophila CBS 207.26]